MHFLHRRRSPECPPASRTDAKGRRKGRRSARKFPRPRPDSGPSTARTADSAARAASAPAPWRCALPARHGDKRQAPASADSRASASGSPSGISGSAGADSCVSCAGSACAAFRSSSSFCALCARSASSDASCESVTICEKARCLLPSASPAPRLRSAELRLQPGVFGKQMVVFVCDQLCFSPSSFRLPFGARRRFLQCS